MVRSSNIGSRKYSVSSPKRPDLSNLGPTQLPNQWVPGFYPRSKVAGREVCHSSFPSADVKNEWIHTSTPSMPTCHGQGKCHLHIYVYSCHSSAVIIATNLLPPWSRVPLEKPTVTWLVKKPLSIPWDRNVHSRVHKILSLLPTLRQTNPLHTVQLCFFKINLNIILPSTLRSYKIVHVFHISLS